MKKIREYIFVDAHRLASYYDQIGSGSFVEKTLTWRASISLKGPQFELSSGASLKEPTIHGMIERLDKYLRSTGQVRLGRESLPMRNSEVLFSLESCVAQRVLIPIKNGEISEGIKYLALWISYPPVKQEVLRARDALVRPIRIAIDFIRKRNNSIRPGHAVFTPGTLYLIEMASEDDIPFVNTQSGYAVLLYVIRQSEYLRRVFLKNLMGVEISESNLDNSSGLFFDFARQPITHLERLGATLSPPRRIHCLYRRRITFCDDAMVPASVSTVGYPIYITSD